MVIPLRDRNPTRIRSWVNWLLILVNVVVFVGFEPWAAEDPCVQQEFFLTYAAIPYELGQGRPLDAREVEATTPPRCNLEPVENKQVYGSILSAMFLHAGWAHLLGNMLFLWIFGNNIEDRLGHLRYLAFYLLCGLLATIAFVVPNLASPVTLVGASGAIAGVLGAYFVLFPRARITVIVWPLWFLPFRLPALLVLGGWFVLQVFGIEAAQMSGGGVAYLAHAAGFGAGMLLIRRFARGRPPAPQYADPRLRAGP